MYIPHIQCHIYIYFCREKVTVFNGFLCSRHKHTMLFNNLHNPINWLLMLFPLTLEATNLKKLSEF